MPIYNITGAYECHEQRSYAPVRGAHMLLTIIILNSTRTTNFEPCLSMATDQRWARLLFEGGFY